MNRRWFAPVLILLLLSGCCRTTKPAPSEALYETKPTDYVGFSSIYEVAETGGALSAVSLDTQNPEGFRFIGEDILLFSGYPQSVLTLLDGRSFAVRQEITLPSSVFPEDPGITVSAAGITYVDETARELVFLNTALQELKRIVLPDGSVDAVLTKNQQVLYYCTTNGLWALDLASGLVRPVTQMHFPRQEIVDIHCSETILQCRVLYEDGTWHTLFLSADDGTRLYESRTDAPLWTDGDLYFTICWDGEYRELISGSSDFGPSILVTETDPVSIVPILTKKLLLLQSVSPDGHIILDTYHLESGTHTSKIMLPGEYRILDIQPDPQEDALWLLCQVAQTEQDVLCRWDLNASDPDDSHTYLHPRWNPGYPDLDGLAQCEIIAAELSEKYGIQILLRTADDIPGNTDCRFLPEYQVPLIRDFLEELDQVLSQYPDGFFRELAEPTGSGKLKIGLVRCIRRNDEALSSLLYWDNRADVWLMVTPGQNLPQQIHPLLFDLMDCRVLGVSDAYDSWDRADTDCSAHQERIRILESAISDGQVERFASAAMQAQLLQLCLGIRETFQSAKTNERLPWEQYLAHFPEITP